MKAQSIHDWMEMRLKVESWQHKDDQAPVVVRIKEPKRLLVLRNDVPATRSDCPITRPCGHIRCRWNLWRIDSDDRPGRPHQGKRAPTTLRAAWLETPTPPSCALDYIEKGEQSSSQIAEALGTDRTNVWLIWQRPRVKAAFERLREMLGSGEP
jgi:hypothetical protein